MSKTLTKLSVDRHGIRKPITKAQEAVCGRRSPLKIERDSAAGREANLPGLCGNRFRLLLRSVADVLLKCDIVINKPAS